MTFRACAVSIAILTAKACTLSALSGLAANATTTPTPTSTLSTPTPTEDRPQFDRSLDVLQKAYHEYLMCLLSQGEPFLDPLYAGILEKLAQNGAETMLLRPQEAAKTKIFRPPPWHEALVVLGELHSLNKNSPKYKECSAVQRALALNLKSVALAFTRQLDQQDSPHRLFPPKTRLGVVLEGTVSRSLK